MTQFGYRAGMPIGLLLTRYGEDQPVLQQSRPAYIAAAALIDSQSLLEHVLHHFQRIVHHVSGILHEPTVT